MSHFSIPERSLEEIEERYCEIRNQTETITQPLQIEDMVVQPAYFVSPPKWHLGHTSWFFETFLLAEFKKDYKPFHPKYAYLFNSYYNTLGDRVMRDNRGFLTRPTVEEVYEYRRYVDAEIKEFLSSESAERSKKKWHHIIEIGMQHEQQHQELLWCDIKYILGNNPLYPHYGPQNPLVKHSNDHEKKRIEIEGGHYAIGYDGDGFCYDNELGVHEVKLPPFAIDNSPVTNGEYLEFMEDGGYENFKYWHDEGFAFIRDNGIKAPLYWHVEGSDRDHYTLSGYRAIDPDAPVNHVSFYEAAAYAAWKGARLPSEYEWEAASEKIEYGRRWEWTNSAYLPYPGFNPPKDALGEYNGKFMINQMVLRGGSIATSPGHARKTYRNFFHPEMRWQFSGIRLAHNIDHIQR